MYLYLFTSMAWNFICTVCSTVSSSVNVMLWTKFKYEKGINSFSMQKELWFLYNATLLIQIYLSMKFPNVTSNNMKYNKRQSLLNYEKG